MAVARTAQAVKAARALEPDLVLMDVRMPALGGIDQIWLRYRDQSTPSPGP